MKHNGSTAELRGGTRRLGRAPRAAAWLSVVALAVGGAVLAGTQPSSECESGTDGSGITLASLRAAGRAPSSISTWRAVAASGPVEARQRRAAPDDWQPVVRGM